MSVTISRTLLFAEDSEAHDIVRALEAVTDTVPVWDKFTRRDGTETDGAVLALADSVIEVHVGRPALLAVLELTVDGLPAVLERLLNAGFTARTWPTQPDCPLERASVSIGELTLVAFAAARSVIVSAPDADVDADRPRRSGRTSTGIWLSWVSEPDAAGRRIPRRIFVTTAPLGSMILQVEKLVEDEPMELRDWAVAEAGRLLRQGGQA